MTPHRAAALALLVLALALAGVVAATTPWSPAPRPASGRTAVDAARDFTPAEQSREDAFHRRVRPAAYASLLLGLVVAGVLGLTSAGARLVGAVARPLGGGWAWQVVLGVAVLGLVGTLVTLPLSVWRERALRDYRLSTQDWGSWTLDLLKGYGVSTAVGAVALLGFVAIVRAAPRSWWAWTAVAAAAFVVVASFLYPLVVEPVFNRFQPMPDGPLRTSLVRLAEQDGVPVTDVLVADASRRTSALNAYVSGFGSTRRIVVYDTLLERSPPEEVRLVVAHELGHAKRRDVLHGTLLGALGAGVACTAAFLLLTAPPLQRRAGVDGPGDGRVVALVLFLVAVATLVSTPLQNLVSRRVEARADVHALDLTEDPTTFVAMQRRLALSNLSDLDPPAVVYGVFASHPTAPERIAIARDWATVHRVPVP